jgi:DNA-binding transcriptional LysR family regulator
MELREVEYVLVACRTMDFTRAAKRCGVTQPTLTRGIRKLERAPGARCWRANAG